MKAVKYILVDAGQEYNNEVELSNGVNLVVNTTIESVENINREVTVIAAPDNTILKKGDKLIIHHNILRISNSTSGKEVHSEYFVGYPYDNVYIVPPTEIFAYKRDGKWLALDPFVFVKPVKKDKPKYKGSLVLPDMKTEYEPNVGDIYFINRELQEWGLQEGDRVFFTDNSEYEFNIGGELLYRMKTSDILAKF